MKILFLSHDPHEVHLNFAKTLNSTIKIIPFKNYVRLMKKIKFLGLFYYPLSFLYSLFINLKEDIIFVEGGSSLYVAISLKFINKRAKIIYLDCDLLFYNLFKDKEKRSIRNKIIEKLANQIDGVLSVSEQNKSFISKFTKVPIEITFPYPKKMKRIKIKKENYGIYIGRLDSDKNIDRIVRFALQCPYFEKFLIIGDGVLRKNIEKIANKNKKIVYFGEKSDVERYYSQCKFLIHIPDADPHPCTTMESAICGCFPIISIGVGSKYLFSKKFVIKNPDDFDEINKKIKNIIENEKKYSNILKKSIKIIPKKQDSLKNFEEKFKKVVNSLETK